MAIWKLIITAVAAFGAFLIASLLGKKVIPALHKLKFGQTILDEGPSWHKAKQGTPTMGGVLFIAGMYLAFGLALLVAELVSPVKIVGDSFVTGHNALRMTQLFGGLIMALFIGGIGFVDDFIKIKKKRNLGLTSTQKLLLQVLVSASYAVALYAAGGSEVVVPFVDQPVDFGLWFIPFTILVIVGTTNATNITDGIDGLCGTVSFVAALSFMMCSSLLSYFGQTVAVAAFAGGLAGFLVWNLHPAKVFMGDTGSLFIGGALCAFAFGLNRPLLLLPIGLLYIIETMSVILQVGYFKLTKGKRLFKMSPIHHHFEMSGFSENKIVLTFSCVGIIGGAAGILMLFA